MTWRDFFESEHKIYVNARHRALHDDRIARAIARHIPAPNARVLDYGCGEASCAADLARDCGALYLFDASRRVQSHLRQRFAGSDKIVVLDEAGFENLPDGGLDLIVVVSVLQYVGEAECARWLAHFYDKLAPGGALVLGDVVPKTGALADDVGALLAFAWRGGFFFAALGGLLRTATSSYRTMRSRIGLTRYEETEMLDLLRDNRFSPTRLPDNMGHDPKRMSFLARKREPA